MKAFLFVLGAALVLTGCGGAVNGSAGSSRGGDAGAVARPGGPPAANPADPASVTLPDRAVVYTANLTVRASDVSRAAAGAKQIVAAVGGHVGEETSTDTPGSRPTSTITFRVPSRQYQAVLDQLGSSRIGRRLSLRQEAEDVTQEVADVDSRVRSAKATIASFRALLGRSGSVSEVIQVEQEISQREADLESLQARQKSYRDRTALATVTLRLESGTANAPGHRRATGFTGGAAAGWRAFTAFVGGLALVLGWLLPFLVVAAMAGVPALWVWRRRRTAMRVPRGSTERTDAV